MSTPANIAELDKNGTLRVINVAMDGDMSETGAGPRLLAAYHSPEKVRKLMSLGDLAHVGFTPKQANAFKEYGNDWSEHTGIGSVFSEDVTAGKLSEKQLKENRSKQDKWFENVDHYTHAFGRDRGRSGEKTQVIKGQIPKSMSPAFKIQRAMDAVNGESLFGGDYTYLYDDKTRKWYTGSQAVPLSKAINPLDMKPVLADYRRFQQNPRNPRLPAMDSNQIHKLIDERINGPKNDPDYSLKSDARYAKGSLEANANAAKNARGELKVNGGRLSNDHKYQLKQDVKIDSDPKIKHRLTKKLGRAEAEMKNLRQIDRYIHKYPEMKLYSRDLELGRHTGRHLVSSEFAHGYDKLNRFAQVNEQARGVDRLNHFAHNAEFKQEGVRKRDTLLSRVPSGRQLHQMHKAALHEGHSKNQMPNRSELAEYQKEAREAIKQGGKRKREADASRQKAVSPKQVRKAITTDPYLRKEVGMYTTSQADRRLTADYNHYQNEEAASPDYREPTEFGIPVSTLEHNTGDKQQQITNKYSWGRYKGTGLFTAERVDGSADTFRPMTKDEIAHNINDIQSQDSKLTKRILHPEKDRLNQKIKTGDIIKDVQASQKAIHGRILRPAYAGFSPDEEMRRTEFNQSTDIPKNRKIVPYDQAFSKDLRYAMGVRTLGEAYGHQLKEARRNRDQKLAQKARDRFTSMEMNGDAMGHLYDAHTEKPVGAKELISRLNRVGRKAKAAHKLSSIIRSGDGIVKHNEMRRHAKDVQHRQNGKQRRLNARRMAKRSPIRNHGPHHDGLTLE